MESTDVRFAVKAYQLPCYDDGESRTGHDDRG